MPCKMNMTMSSMPMKSSNSTGMVATMMATTFFSSDFTPLFSTAWTPENPAAYGATCLFLIAFAVMHRGLNTIKAAFDRRCRSAEGRRNRSSNSDTATQAEEKAVGYHRVQSNGNEEEMEHLAGSNDSVKPDVSSHQRSWFGLWRLSEDMLRTLIVTCSAAVGYLLMLAVMTLNVGYFLSVLAGIALGELFLGRLSPASLH